MQMDMLHKDAAEMEKLIDERNCLEEKFTLRWAVSLCNDEPTRNSETDGLLTSTPLLRNVMHVLAWYSLII